MGLQKRVRTKLQKRYVNAIKGAEKVARREFTRDWDWVRGEKRDIIDTGQLYRSIEVTIDLDIFTSTISYGRNYRDDKGKLIATIVKQGKGKNYPARDYTIAPRETFRKLWLRP